MLPNPNILRDTEIRENRLERLAKVQVAKALIDGFVEVLSEDTIASLYTKHIAHIKNLKQQMMDNLGTTGKRYTPQPASTVKTFKTRYLRSVLVNMLLETEHCHYFMELKDTDVAKILNLAVGDVRFLLKNMSTTFNRIHGKNSEVYDLLTRLTSTPDTAYIVE